MEGDPSVVLPKSMEQPKDLGGYSNLKDLHKATNPTTIKK